MTVKLCDSFTEPFISQVTEINNYQNSFELIDRSLTRSSCLSVSLQLTIQNSKYGSWPLQTNIILQYCVDEGMLYDDWLVANIYYLINRSIKSHNCQVDCYVFGCISVHALMSQQGNLPPIKPFDALNLASGTTIIFFWNI